MFDARSNTKPFFIISLALLFLFNSLGGDILIGEVWAARSSSGLTSVGLDSTGSPTPLKSLSAATFTLPRELGYIQESAEVPNSGRTVIHIQDAHCNYAAQKSIAEILDYLTTEYGIYAVNCEGAAKGYDLSPFTVIPEKDIREKTSDYFVKEGVVSAAEYYAVNNPEKVKLWGVEDPDLYLKDLKVYRDSLAHKAEVDRYIKSIGYILNNLKRHIYSGELLELDKYYTGYKENKITFKEYILYLIAMARKRIIDIKSFPNIYLLNQTLSDEDKINFKRANNEKDEVVDKLKKILSKNELEELVIMVGKLKTERISQADFYAYLAKKARSVKLDMKDYPELGKYIIYVSIYNAIDRSKIAKEMETIEDKIKESLYENDTQRELGVLSKNLAITKNIFNITLMRDDYTYYEEHRETFAVANYVSFIDKKAPLYKIRATLDKNIGKLDEYRNSMDQFYQISLERDKAFIKNIKFTDHDRPNSIIITGGFHTDNLRELFKNEKVSYISIMPKFKNEKGYESPYMKRLAGQRTALENVIDTAIPAVLNLQVVEILSARLAVEVEGEARLERFRLAVLITSFLMRGENFILKVKAGAIQGREQETEKFITFTKAEGAEGMGSSISDTSSVGYNAELIDVGANDFVYTVNLNLPQTMATREELPHYTPVNPPEEKYPTFMGNLTINGQPRRDLRGGFEFTPMGKERIAVTPPGMNEIVLSVAGTMDKEKLIKPLEGELKRPDEEVTVREKDEIRAFIEAIKKVDEIAVLKSGQDQAVKGFFFSNKLYISQDLIDRPLLIVRPQALAIPITKEAEPMYAAAKKIVPEIAHIMRRGSPTYLISPAMANDIAPTTNNNRTAEQILGKQGHKITAKSYPVDEKWVENLKELLEKTLPAFKADLSNPTTRMAIRFMPDKDGKIAEDIREVIRKYLSKEYSDEDIADILKNQVHLIPISIQKVEHLNSSIDLFTDLSMMEIDRYLKGAYPGEELPPELRDKFLALLKLSITNFDDLMKVVKTEEDIEGILNAIFNIGVLLRIKPVDWKSIDDWKRENNAVLQSA